MTREVPRGFPADVFSGERLNKRDLFFNGMMSVGMIGLMIGVFGRYETIAFIASAFVLIIWISSVAVHRNDESRKQIEKLKQRIAQMQCARNAAPEAGAQDGESAETPAAPADADGE